MAARAIAQGLLAGNIDPDVEMPRLRDWKNSPDFTIPAEALETYPLFARLAPENLGYAVANMAVRQGRYPRVDGQETRFEHVVGTPGGHVSPYTLPPEPEVPVLNPEGYDILAAKATAQIEAVRAAMAARDEGADRDSEKQEAPIEFTVRNYRSGGAAVFITKPKLVAVTKKFNNPSEARQYLKNNREALEAKVRRLMQGPNERRAENRVRTGPVWRMGDATEAMFLNELGFRGVAFGKSTTADERQSRMNDTYDAMMDLAGILNVPPKMLSLNGRLGLGFGTHGKGGKGHWAGVFMQAPGNPDTDQTIAFVRKGGAGVLAHEWFHAIDNFLARHDSTETNVSAALTTKKAENRTDFMSDRPRNRGKLTDSQYQAFRALRAALTGSDWKTRMDAYDKMRAEPYWGTTIELAARAFERMIVDQLYLRDMSNDFLANVDDTSGAYLTRPANGRARPLGARSRSVIT